MIIELDLLHVISTSLICVIAGGMIGYMRGLMWYIDFLERIKRKEQHESNNFPQRQW